MIIQEAETILRTDKLSHASEHEYPVAQLKRYIQASFGDIAALLKFPRKIASVNIPASGIVAVPSDVKDLFEGKVSINGMPLARKDISEILMWQQKEGTPRYYSFEPNSADDSEDYKKLYVAPKPKLVHPATYVTALIHYVKEVHAYAENPADNEVLWGGVNQQHLEVGLNLATARAFMKGGREPDKAQMFYQQFAEGFKNLALTLGFKDEDVDRMLAGLTVVPKPVDEG